ncbi:MAG: integrase arm-type DNA-binding domain-containing protein [Burkholderiales bacterium]|nr:integrase arm-type DNA-binding domain-containing protein [Burkholderiales bacterium]
MALTVIEIKHAKPGNYIDGNGLYLQVSKAGSKSWIYRYQINGKRREMGLGAVDTVPPGEARAKAAELKTLASKGIDPIEQRRKAQAEAAAKHAEQKSEADKALHTFAAVAEEYIAMKASEWASAKHAQQWTNTLDTYAAPIIGAVPVAEITSEHIWQILTPIWTTKTETATRVRSRIELVLDYATGRGWRTGENPARWRGRLKSTLATPSRIRNVRHHPALPREKMPAFMAALRRREGAAARALEFAILTAARSGEVRGARWGEIDLDAKMWNIPATRMKAKKKHRIPLSGDALVLLRALPRIAGNDLVFPGSRDSRPLSDMSLSAVVRRMNEGEEGPRWVDEARVQVVPHGFRSTFRDWAAEATHYPNEMAEIALAHTIGNKAEAAYRRTDMLDKRRQMMEDWAAVCRTVKGRKLASSKKQTA